MCLAFVYKIFYELITKTVSLYLFFLTILIKHKKIKTKIIKKINYKNIKYIYKKNNNILIK